MALLLPGGLRPRLDRTRTIVRQAAGCQLGCLRQVRNLDHPIDRFAQLAQENGALLGPGTPLALREELGLGSGQFNDQLTETGVKELNTILETRLTQLES